MFVALLSTAFAGDPCPIDFRLSNLGPIDKPGAVEVADDAVFQRLVAWLAKQDCTAVRVVVPADGVLPLGDDPAGAGLQAARLRGLALDTAGSFRCADAHTVFVALSAVPASGHVVYLRGTRRVLLSAAGWGTACIDLAELESGGDAALQKLWVGATGALVKDRHDNP